MVGSLMIILLFVLLYVSWRLWNYRQFCRVLSSLPGPKTTPIFGNALQLESNSDGFLRQIKGWCETYRQEGVMCVWLASLPFVLVYRPDYVETLLSSQKNIAKSQLYALLHPWLGTGLLTSEGAKWKSRRRLLTSTFHFKILNTFVSIFQKQSSALVERLKEKVSRGPFDIGPYIALCGLDIICETSMGVNVNAQFESESEYVKAIVGASELIQHRQKSPWLYPDIIYNLIPDGRKFKGYLKILHGFTNKVIDDRIKERRDNKDLPETAVISSTNRRILVFLDLLLEEYDKGNIDKEGVREEVDTFMFEGHDTTAASMLWTIHLLGKHPDIQAKLQQEIDEFYETVVEEEINVDHLKKLNYLECVVKESLRLFPSVPLMARQLSEDIKLGPYDIPKGCSLGVVTVGLHQNPDVWDNPSTFDPDRFTMENVKERHPFAYTPFSAGPRNCIGQKFAMLEEKIVLSSVVRNFRIHSLQNTEDIKQSAELILRSMEGYWVKLEPRNTEL